MAKETIMLSVEKETCTNYGIHYNKNGSTLTKQVEPFVEQETKRMGTMELELMTRVQFIYELALAKLELEGLSAKFTKHIRDRVITQECFIGG